MNKYIKEQVLTKLIDFGNNKIQKSDRSDSLFKIGDKIYCDDETGEYTNLNIGSFIGLYIGNNLCVEYQKLVCGWWANANSALYNDIIPYFDNGWEATQYIKTKYKDCINDTIFKLFGDNEYIPTAEELVSIFNKIHQIDKDVYYSLTNEYWTTSAVHINENGILNMPLYVFTFDGYSHSPNIQPVKYINIVDKDADKSSLYDAIVILKMN